MLDNLKLEKILFLDIETVSQQPKFELLDEKLKTHWEKKATSLATNNETPEEIYNRAGI
ncbi:MAG: 3'-5' exonuclease, partial [Flavobacteriales bacterium CG_4_10_14_0_8_um_filter_32_5]